MMEYTRELYRFKLNNLDGDKWDEYIAADSSLSAFGHMWESLNSEKEFIEQMEYIDEVHFKIEDEKSGRKKMNKIQGTIVRLNMVIVDRDTELSYTKKTANNRLALLRREHEDAKTHGHCAFCEMEVDDFDAALFITISWNHADGCELSEELGE